MLFCKKANYSAIIKLTEVAIEPQGKGKTEHAKTVHFLKHVTYLPVCYIKMHIQ
jgi:hypothetical protein